MLILLMPIVGKALFLLNDTGFYCNLTEEILMRNLESWGFICLMGCPLFVTLSLTVLTGGWAIAGNIIAAILGVLSGGFYGASVWYRGRSDD
jgi:hypothetical protein